MGQIRSSSVMFLLTLLSACGGGGGGASPVSAPIVAGPQTSPVVKNKVSGVVADKSGKPVAGVTISVFHHNTNTTVTTTTDASGAYLVAGQDTGAN